MSLWGILPMRSAAWAPVVLSRPPASSLSRRGGSGIGTNHMKTVVLFGGNVSTHRHSAPRCTPTPPHADEPHSRRVAAQLSHDRASIGHLRPYCVARLSQYGGTSVHANAPAQTSREWRSHVVLEAGMGLPETAEAWEAAILLVDKPKHWTSFDVCGKLRVLLTEPGSSRKRRRKVGHAGTLDPLATGLLIVCVGKATKAVESLMGMDKEYSGVLRLGESTPSYDAGTPVNRQLPWEDITDEEMQAAAQALTGDISQVPPMFSAIKVAGKRLYDLARKGRELELQPRAVRVDEFSVWRDSPRSQDVNYRIRCSKGCYVRSLVRDLGDALGSAAYVKTLCRDAIGGFRLSQAWSMDALVEGLTEQKLLYWPRPPRRQDGPLKAADGALPSTTHDNC